MGSRATADLYPHPPVVCMINMEAIDRVEKNSSDSFSVYLKHVSAPQTISRR
jgi:hypothetical protein